LVSAGSDGAIRLWNIAAGRPLETVLSRNTDTAQHVALTNSGSVIGAGVSRAVEWRGDGNQTSLGPWPLEILELSEQGSELVLAAPFADTQGGLFLTLPGTKREFVELPGATGHSWIAEFSAEDRWL